MRERLKLHNNIVRGNWPLLITPNWVRLSDTAPMLENLCCVYCGIALLVEIHTWLSFYLFMLYATCSGQSPY